MAEVFLSLGSNIGNREGYLKQAVNKLVDEAGDVVCCSSLWETEAWGFSAETAFLNMVVVLDTALSPHELLEKIHSIEKQLGRQRSGGGYQSRTIDIDILFWGREVISDADLKIPHPAIADRLFVLVPLNEIAPDFTDPVTGMKVSEMQNRCADKSEVHLFSKGD